MWHKLQTPKNVEIFEKVVLLFKDLNKYTDVVSSKKKANLLISDFDITNLEMIIRDIQKSPDFDYVQKRFSKEISPKKKLLELSIRILEEVKKMERQGETAEAVKQESRVFRDYDTKTSRQKKAASLEKFYNRIRNSEVSGSQPSLKNSSSVFLFKGGRNAMKNQLNRSSKGTSRDKNQMRPPQMPLKKSIRSEPHAHLLLPKTGNESSLVHSIPYTTTQETTPSSNPQVYQYSKSPFTHSEISMESALIAKKKRRQTAKFGNANLEQNFQKQSSPTKQSNRTNAQQMLNASENIYQEMYRKNSSQNRRRHKIVESEKIMNDHKHRKSDVLFAREMDAVKSKGKGGEKYYQQICHSEVTKTKRIGKDVGGVQVVDSAKAKSFGIRTLQSNSINFQNSEQTEITSINDKIDMKFHEMPSNTKIRKDGSIDYYNNKFSDFPEDSMENIKTRKSNIQSKKEHAHGHKKKKTYRTEIPKKKSKKNRANEYKGVVQSLKQNTENAGNLTSRRKSGKMKTKSTQNLTKKSRLGKKKKSLVPPKDESFRKKKINNHSLDRHMVSKRSQNRTNPKNPKNAKKLTKKTSGFIKIEGSYYERHNTIKGKSSQILSHKPKKTKKMRTNSYGKSRYTNRTGSKEISHKIRKQGLKHMEEKILNKPQIPPIIGRSTGNLIHDITQFSHSRAEINRDSFVKKNTPYNYKSSNKDAKSQMLKSNKKSMISTQQSIRSRRKKPTSDPFGSSDNEDEHNTIFEQIQNVLMKSHEELRAFALDIREEKKLKRIFIGSDFIRGKLLRFGE